MKTTGERNTTSSKEFVESSRELASHVLVPALNDVMNRFVCHKSTVVVRWQVRTYGLGYA